MNTELFNSDVNQFIELANKHQVRMLLVGGGAVNLYGYQRHSADVDFWIDISLENIEKIRQTIVEFGINMESFPQEVLNGEQNISIKISPISEIELITKFNPYCSFEEAYARKTEIINNGLVYSIINLSDLINSKVKSLRPKDLLDIYELKRIHKLD